MNPSSLWSSFENHPAGLNRILHVSPADVTHTDSRGQPSEQPENEHTYIGTATFNTTSIGFTWSELIALAYFIFYCMIVSYHGNCILQTGKSAPCIGSK